MLKRTAMAGKYDTKKNLRVRNNSLLGVTSVNAFMASML